METNKLGGCTTREYQAWKRDFRSKAAQKELQHPKGLAHVREPYILTQRDVGQAKGPSLKGPVCTEQQMRAALVDHFVSAYKIGETRLVDASEWRGDELILWMFAQFKPDDPEHKVPRWVLNLKWANEPAQSGRNRRQKRSGAKGSRATTTPDDLAVVLDAKKGYKQVGVDDATGRKQRHLTPLDVHLEVCAILEECGHEAPWPTTKTRIEIVSGVPHVVNQPTTVQFGGATSGDIFTDRLGLPLAELRQAGLRVETMVDDMELKSRYGPGTLITEMLILMTYLGVYGWMLHCTGGKANQCWPRSTWVFDGVLMRARDLMVFSPEERDRRHRAQLQSYWTAGGRGERHTLRDLSRVLGQQVSHRTHHYPTALILPTATAFLASETRRLATMHGMLSAWDQTVDFLPEVARSDLLQLLQPRSVGDHMRKQTGTALATVTVDAGQFAAGYQIVDHRDGANGRTLSGTMMLEAAERQQHHTVQELIATARVTEMAIKQLDLHGTDTPAASLVIVRNDNTAGVKNLERPGNKPAMTEPTVDLQVLARARGLYPIASYINKYFMDVLSKVDFMSRPVLHYGDLGLDPLVLQCASSALRLQLKGMIDATACRATCQPAASQFIARYPTLGAMQRADIRSYDLSNDAELNGKLLYLFPPEAIIADVVWKLSQEPRRDPTILVVPAWTKRPTWWPTLLELIHEYVTVKPDERNYVQPGAPAVIIDPPPWTLIICALSTSHSETGGLPIPRRQPQSSQPTWMGEVVRSFHGAISLNTTTHNKLELDAGTKSY